jgi:hypothetical protein
MTMGPMWVSVRVGEGDGEGVNVMTWLPREPVRALIAEQDEGLFEELHGRHDARQPERVLAQTQGRGEQ